MKKMIHLLRLLPAILLMVSATAAHSQSSMQDPYKIKQMFMYHFLKYIQWPDDNTSQDFVIGVVGDQKMMDVLSTTFHQGKRKNRTYQLKFFETAAAVKDCEVVFLGKNESGQFEELLSSLIGNKTLIITDKNGLGSMGSCINFREQSNKLQFELNMKAMEKAGLKVAGQLTQVAILL